MKQIYFGQRISQLRRENGMTQETLAQRLGISNQAVSKWESDQCCPDIMQLPQLADLFGITLDALFGRTQAEKTALCAVASLPWEDDNSLRAVCFLGRKLLEAQELPHHSQALEKVQLNFQGAVEDVKSAFSVYCPGTAIGGDVKAGDGVTCGDVSGDVKAGDGVTCGEVKGSVTVTASPAAISARMQRPVTALIAPEISAAMPPPGAKSIAARLKGLPERAAISTPQMNKTTEP